jgi:hypothetical protein
MAEAGKKKRRWERHVPAHPVRVAAETEAIPSATGEALNLSDRGAPAWPCRTATSAWATTSSCCSASPVPPTPAPAGPCPPPAASSGPEAWGRPRYGVEWTHQGPQRSWIGWLTRV